MQELERAKASGGLSDVIYCFSQEPGMPRTYVQDGIDINADRLAALLATPAAHYYLSGARPAPTAFPCCCHGLDWLCIVIRVALAQRSMRRACWSALHDHLASIAAQHSGALAAALMAALRCAGDATMATSVAAVLQKAVGPEMCTKMQAEGRWHENIMAVAKSGKADAAAAAARQRAKLKQMEWDAKARNVLLVCCRLARALEELHQLSLLPHSLAMRAPAHAAFGALSAL